MPLAGVSHQQEDLPAEVILRFPDISRRTWFRLARLAHARGAFAGTLDPYVLWDLFSVLTDDRFVTASGQIRDIVRLKQYMARRRGLTFRQVDAYRAALLSSGWIRQTQRPAPGYKARYELQLPLHLIPNALPEDLARELRLWDEEALPDPDHADTLVGYLHEAELEPVSTVPPADWTAPQPPAQAPDDAPQQTPENPASAEVNSPSVPPSPYSREGAFPLWVSTCTTPGVISRPDREPARRPPRRRREPISGEELEAARQVLARCEPWWQRQLGPRGVLSAGELAGLVEPVALALRRATPTELVEELTVQIRTARALVDVVGHRAWRLIKTRPEWGERPEDALPADEAGHRYSLMLARRSDNQNGVMGRTAQLRTRLRQALTAGRDARPDAGQPYRPDGIAWHREDERAFLTERAVAEFEATAPPLEVYRRRTMQPPPCRR
jgi:hypothetical protein